jgi:hypothetical protein
MGKMVKVFWVLVAVILGFETTTDVGLALFINLGRSWAVMGTSVLMVGASVLQDQSEVRQQVQLLGKL